MASTPRRPWSEQEAARALADVYQVLLRDHVAEYRQALAQAIDAARDAIAKAQGATVVTRDLGGFDGCGVPLIDPWQG